MKKKVEAEKENGERWMLTYLDMITLLFVTFVVLYAISVADKAKFEAVAESLSHAFGEVNLVVSGTGSGMGDGQGKVLTLEPQKLVGAPVQSKNARSLAYDNVYTILQTEVRAGKMSVIQEERGIIIQLGANFFFKSGSADLPDEETESLITLAQALTLVPNEIEIEGFADSNELKAAGAASKFTSSWQLASQRAVNLLGFFQDQGVSPDKMRAVSFGSTKAVVGNDTEEGRAYNRHVDILLLYNTEVTVTPPATE